MPARKLGPKAAIILNKTTHPIETRSLSEPDTIEVVDAWLDQDSGTPNILLGRYLRPLDSGIEWLLQSAAYYHSIPIRTMTEGEPDA